MGDPYEILGISHTSEDVVIRAAYTALIRKYHPDTFDGDKTYADARTKEINAAYALLRDPAKRAAYDAGERDREIEAWYAREYEDDDAHVPETAAEGEEDAEEIRPERPPRRNPLNWANFAIVIAVAAIAVLGMIGFDRTIPPLARYREDGGPNLPILQTGVMPAPTKYPSLPVKISWSVATQNDPSLYAAGPFSIQLSSGSDVAGDPIAILDADFPDAPHLRFDGQPGLEDPAAILEVMKLDRGRPDPAIVFITYSGGAGCCARADIFEPEKDGWQHAVLKGRNNLLTDLPSDIDRDGTLDIVGSDTPFEETFGNAERYAPPIVYNLLHGELADVSSTPGFSPFYRDEMVKAQAGCLLHRNSACAAFVAAASRLGLHDWAWDSMIANYDPAWSDRPPSQKSTATFPQVLETFLRQNRYVSGRPTNDTGASHPSFGCRIPDNPVLKLVCTTSSLAAADRTLAAAYTAALEENPDSDTLKNGQLDWIRERNSRAPDAASLQQFYTARIDYLIALARNTDALHVRR